MTPRRPPSNARKLLIASIGIATVSYVIACEGTTSGNLMAQDPGPYARDGSSSIDSPTSGNLMAIEPDSATDDSSTSDAPTSGNLMAPDAAEPDAAADASDAKAPSDAADAGDAHD